MNRCLIVVLVTVAAGVSFVDAQQEATFKAGIHTVSLYATVVDASGRLVPSLEKEDFEVFDNGQRQTLTVFKNDIQAITIVIMLDRSGSMVRNFDLVRDAAEHFVGTLLPTDKARLGSFSNRIQIDPPDFTSDQAVLVQILHNNLQDAGPTPLWNATSAAMTALVRQDGRRVVLLFTDGNDSPTRPGFNVSLSQVADRSQAEGIMVYGIGLADACGPSPAAALRSPSGILLQGRGGGGRGGGPIVIGGGGRIGGGLPLPPSAPPLGPGGLPGGTDLPGGGSGHGGDGPGGGRPGASRPGAGGGSWSGANGACAPSKPDPGLKTLAEEGGGGYFELHGTDDLNATFARVADELHHQYVLAFTAASLDGKVHKLDVHVRQPTMTARARKSYLAAADK